MFASIRGSSASAKRSIDQVLAVERSPAEKSITDFLTLASAPVEIPSLSVEALAQTRAVSQLTKVDVRSRDGASSVLQGLVLPSHMHWPFFHTCKTSTARDKHVVFHRVQGLNAARHQRVFQLVNELNESAVIIGSQCIGKTCSMNYYLMEYVRHIGEPGWKKVVLVHLRSTFLTIYRDESTGELKCFESDASSLKELNALLAPYWALPKEEVSQVVLLLELEESDRDPIVGNIPCILTLSNSDTNKVLKTMMKGGGLHWLLEEHPSEEEAEACVRLLNAASTSGDKYDWENFAKHRWNIIPRPRSFLAKQNAHLYQDRPDGLCYYLENISIFNVPDHASDFIAPYFVSEATDPDAFKPLPDGRRPYEFKMFNLETALRVGKAIKKQREIRALEGFGLRWQIEEACAAYGGLLEGQQGSVDRKHTRAEWEWYDDRGPSETCVDAEGTLKYPKNAPPIPLPQCDALSPFTDQYLPATAEQMTEGLLYHADKHGCPLASFLFKHNQTVFAVQVSSVACEKHKIRLDALETFLDRLGLLREEDEEEGRERHRLVYLRIMSDTVPSSQGIAVEKSDKKVVSLKAAVRELAGESLECSSYLIRANLLPLEKEYGY